MFLMGSTKEVFKIHEEKVKQANKLLKGLKCRHMTLGSVYRPSTKGNKLTNTFTSDLVLASYLWGMNQPSESRGLVEKGRKGGSDDCWVRGISVPCCNLCDQQRLERGFLTLDQGCLSRSFFWPMYTTFPSGLPSLCGCGLSEVSGYTHGKIWSMWLLIRGKT